MTVLSYPIPPYQNVEMQPEFYQPRQYFIEDIELGVFTFVTTTNPMDYVVGQEVRLVIPPECGCYQLNGKSALILEIISEDQVKLNLNSSQNVDEFVPNSTGTQPQILAIGTINTGNIGAFGNVNQPTFVPGSFVNISPE